MKHPRQAILVANERSRRGRDAANAMPALLRERGVEVLDVRVEPSKKHLCKRVKKLVERDSALIVVCGGDGTLTAAVGHFAHRAATLGVVPAGTGNSFALGLGIDSFESAADAIAHGEPRCVDLGMINGSYFANFVTVGLATLVAEATPTPLKKVFGAAAYGVSAIGPALGHRRFEAKIRSKDHRVRALTHQIIVANGRFYGHEPLSHHAEVDDGRLTVFVRETGGIGDVIATNLALVTGKQHELSNVHLWSTADEVRIACKPRAPVAIDGSAFGKTPLRLKVAHNALRVMGAAAAAAARAS